MSGLIELHPITYIYPQNRRPSSPQSLNPPPYTNNNLRRHLASMPIPSSPPPRYTNNNRRRYIEAIRKELESAYNNNDNQGLQDINRFFPRVPTHAHQERSHPNNLPSLEEIQRRLNQLQRNIIQLNQGRQGAHSGGYKSRRKVNKSRKVGRGKNRQQKKEKEKQKKSTAKNTFTGKHIRHKQHLMELASKRSNISKKSNKKKQRK